MIGTRKCTVQDVIGASCHRLRIRIAPALPHFFAGAEHADADLPAQAALVHVLPIELAPFELPTRTLEALTQLRKSTLGATRATVDARKHLPGITDPDP